MSLSDYTDQELLDEDQRRINAFDSNGHGGEILTPSNAMPRCICGAMLLPGVTHTCPTRLEASTAGIIPNNSTG